MGDFVFSVSALMNDVLGRLTPEVIKELGQLCGFKDDIMAIKEYFSNIQVAEEYKKGREIDSWIKSLRCVTLKVENLLDHVSTEALLQALDKKRGIKYMVRAFFSSYHNQLMFRVRVAHKVKDIRWKLDAIALEISKLSLTYDAVSYVDVDIVTQMPDRETSSCIHESLIFGRNKEMKMVTEKICNKDIGKNGHDKFRVYGICGKTGIGKTTLAQLVFNHERVNQYFDFKCLVYVSEEFQVKKILKDIIECIDECECTLTYLDVLQESLQNKLRGKKFLIVLEDVWIRDFEKCKWDLLSEALSCGVEGSIVVITTRSERTCRMMAKVSELQHNLGCLSENDSWLLFKKFAFAKRREMDDISEIEPIGREIVHKCKGLPLAVKTLGSLMWSKRCTSDWQRVNDSILWELQEYKVLPALRVSYDNLLPHLKRCFAYCCLFPKGYELEKDVVIQLWVVNGFIPPREEIDLYVLGEETFNCLVWRSFFQVAKDKKYLNDRYKIHDLMHDMAQHVMRYDCLVIEPTFDEVSVTNEVLHLSLSRPDEFSSEDLGKLASLRSIFMFGKEYTFNISQIFNHVYLRILYLCDIGLKTLPESICKLKHLKYLNLSYSSIQGLPDSIVYLQKLQVLLLKFCYELCTLPKDLRYMGSLQLLDISSCHSLVHLPFGIKEQTTIRGLSRFHVGNKMGTKIGNLGNLNRLEGELEISGLENVKKIDDSMSANLKFKISLTVLKLSWSNIYMAESKGEMFELEQKEVLEGLEPNPSLKKLRISFYMGKIISPGWMVKLKNLVEIGFFGCKRCEHIPPLGTLPNLRVIKLLGMDSLECFHKKDMSRGTNIFLHLKELSIFICPNLVSLPCNLPGLEVLKVEECGALISLLDDIQSFKSLKTLEITRCKHLSKKCFEDRGVDLTKFDHILDI